METWLSDLVARLVAEEDDRVLIGRQIAAAASGDAAAYLEACRLIGEAGEPVLTIEALRTLPDARTVTAIGALIIHAFAAIRVDYPSRPDATRSRTELGDRAETVYPAAGAEYGHDVLSWLIRLVGRSILHLSEIAANKAPIVRVETGVSLPSSLLAYDLYGEPARGEELLARNAIGTPLLMPVAFEALAE